MFGLEAYLDESGIQSGADVCIAAGFFGKKGAWRRLEAQWRSALASFGVPLKDFRAKNLIKRAGSFKGWGHEKHREFLNALARAIADSRIHPVCYGVFVADFFKFSLIERRFLTGATWDATKETFLSTGCPNKPYFYVFDECLKTVTSHTPAGSRAHFFFGVDRPVAGYARLHFRYLKWRSRIISTDKFRVIDFLTCPSFCTSPNERVYITAVGCEIGFGDTRGLQAAGAGGL